MTQEQNSIIIPEVDLVIEKWLDTIWKNYAESKEEDDSENEYDGDQDGYDDDDDSDQEEVERDTEDSQQQDSVPF